MTRQDFIYQLFDGGNGLTFDQIEIIESVLIDTIPDGVEEDIRRDLGEDATDEGIRESALYMARDVFINSLADCADMIELRDYINSYLSKKTCKTVSDMQTYRLWFSARGAD